MAKKSVYCASSSKNGIAEAISNCIKNSDIFNQLNDKSRIALKPNFTSPFYTPGVTTSPDFIRETVKVLKQYTNHIAIVESDGGYGAWNATEAFKGHGIYDIQKEFGVEVVNLCDEPSELIAFKSGGREHRLPLPVRLLHDTDMLITMPVPKIHCMTGLTLSYKNQWGCIPDTMRLRRHHIFNDAIVAINRALKPCVLADGTYFLDRNGPLEGDAIKMELVIASTDAGAFDRYVSELMGYPWQKVGHFRRAVELGDMPASLDLIEYNVCPISSRSRVFHLSRSFRNWIALTGFRSRFVTWLGYESWFGRVVLHGILYAIVGRPLQAQSSKAVSRTNA